MNVMILWKWTNDYNIVRVIKRSMFKREASGRFSVGENKKIKDSSIKKGIEPE